MNVFFTKNVLYIREMSEDKVKNYYNEISDSYDESRFSNSYGAFIDKQERKFIETKLTDKNNLNLCCGTGCFMEYCSTGLDFSEAMIAHGKKNYPHGNYFVGDAKKAPFQSGEFDTVICFHAVMHLSPEETSEIFNEVNRILKPGGLFIFDYPSAERRKLFRYKAKNWHGGNAFTSKQMKKLIAEQDWKVNEKKGVLFLPIHRFPKKMRKLVFGMDEAFSKSWFKNYSSYLMQCVVKG